jgi:hypothetical protein
MKNYTTKQAIENYTLQSISSSFDLQINAWILAMENYIDNYTGRNFLLDEEATERFYDGDSSNTILVDDFIGDIVLKIGDEEIPAENIFVYPNNSKVKNKIKLSGYIFSHGNQNISVEAKWGFSEEIPADISLACTILVAGIMSYADGSKGKARSESVGRYSITYSDDKGWNDFDRVKGILDFYRKYNLS